MCHRAGNETQVTGSPINTALKFPSSSLQQFPGVTFAGNGGCSPHSNNDYLALRTFVVPTLEVEVPAIRCYRQTADGSDALPSTVTYLDLPVRGPSTCVSTPGHSCTHPCCMPRPMAAYRHHADIYLHVRCLCMPQLQHRTRTSFCGGPKPKERGAAGADAQLT